MKGNGFVSYTMLIENERRKNDSKNKITSYGGMRIRIGETQLITCLECFILDDVCLHFVTNTSPNIVYRIQKREQGVELIERLMRTGYLDLYQLEANDKIKRY